MLEANVVDTSFAHAESMVAGVVPHTLRWNRGPLIPGLPTFFVNEMVLSPGVFDVPHDLRYAVILESKAIVPSVYRKVARIGDRFNKVFTHNSTLLAQLENSVWIPGGGVWVGGSYAGGAAQIHHKTRGVSMLTSRKMMCSLHVRRYLYALILERLRAPRVDVFRQPLIGDYQRISVLDTLEPYRFTVVVENYVDKLYFTEKILNAFSTGTIPVYFGATDIGRLFDECGIVKFSSVRELLAVLPRLDEEYYESRRSAIEDNFERAKQYRSVEDFVVATGL